MQSSDEIIDGELNLAVADQLKAALAQATGYSTVLIDLSSCDCDPHVFRFLQVSGVDLDGLVFDSAEAALGDESGRGRA